MRNGKLIITILYLALTTLFYLRSFSLADELKNIRFFYPDPVTSERVITSVQLDPSGSVLWITRLFHNKPLGYAQSAVTSAAKILDPVFLFSLIPDSAMYDPYIRRYTLLYPFELLFFLLSLVYYFRNNEFHATLRLWVLLYGISLVIPVLFDPDFNKLLLFPIVFVTRVFIVMSLLRITWKKS